MDSRFKVWGEILRLSRLIVVGSVWLFALFDLLAGQFIPKSWDVPRIIEMLPGWSFSTWSALGLLVLLIATLEGAYRAIGKREEPWEALLAKVKRERAESGKALDEFAKSHNATVGKLSQAKGLLSRHVAKGENLVGGEVLGLSDRSAFAWLDEAEQLIQSLLKEKCLEEFRKIASFPRPKTGSPGMIKAFADKHVHALKAFAENLNADDLRDEPQ